MIDSIITEYDEETDEWEIVHSPETLDLLAQMIGEETAESKANISEQTDSEEEDPQQRAEAIADLLIGIYGDNALKLIDKMDLHESLLEAWDPAAHPRGPNGRFIAKNSPEAVQAVKGKVKQALKNPQNPDLLSDLMNHLNILTTRQIHELKKEHKLKGSARNREELVQKIADRLARGRAEGNVQPEEKKMPPGITPPTMSESEKEEVWKKATAYIPSKILDLAGVKGFNIGVPPGEGPSTGGFAKGKEVWVDGSDPRTALHEISHLIEFALHNDDRTNKPMYQLRQDMINDDSMTNSPREKLTVFIEALYSDPDSRAYNWAITQYPEYVKRFKDIEDTIKGGNNELGDSSADSVHDVQALPISKRDGPGSGMRGSQQQSKTSQTRSQTSGSSRVGQDVSNVVPSQRTTSQAEPPQPGFTGTDSLGREWRDGKLVAKQEEPQPEEPAKQKEPWEMTQKDTLEVSAQNRKSRNDNHPYVVYNRQTGDVVTEIPFSKVKHLNTDKYEAKAIGSVDASYDPEKDDGWVDNVKQRHKEIVQQALAQGKPVPPEVLADYPDLQK